jgi:hypothetical protein
LRPQGGKTVWCEFFGDPRSATTDQPALGDVVVLETVAPACT